MKTPISPQFQSAPSLKRRVGGVFAITCLVLLSPVLRAAVPSDPAVEFRFPEGPEASGGNGITTTNTGTLAGIGTFAQPVDPDWETNLAPFFTTNVAVGIYVPAANNFSVDMGIIQGSSLGGSHGRAIDLAPEVNPPTVGAFPELTVVGWLNLRQLPGQTCRIVYAAESPNGSGFDVGMFNNGVISIGINQNMTLDQASSFQVTANAITPSNNWVFFAVTYNPSLISGQVKYYFGRQDKLAALDVEHDYSPPFFPTVDFTGPLAVGNFSPVDDGGRNGALGGNSFIFRGLLDEIKVYTNALTLDQVQQAQLNATVTPVIASILKQPINTAATEGQNATFTVEATGSGLVTYQWKTNGVDVAGATNASFTIGAVQLSQNALPVRVGVSNSVGGVLSAQVTLSVLPNNPFLVATSFSEPAGSTATLITNLGSLAGNGRVSRQASLPTFISTNLPSGPNAPTRVYNQSAILNSLPDAGNSRAVDLTNNLISAAGELGSLNAMTICGWLNSANNTFRTTSTGRGNGLVTATRGGNAGGFVLSYRSSNGGLPYGQNGMLQLSVNAFEPDLGNNVSSADKIPLDVNLSPNNWVFFAVTYDGTVTADNLAFYYGDVNNPATNDVVRTYSKGVMPVTGQLTIGNYQLAAGNPTGRAGSGTNFSAFRGLYDEIKLFSKVLTLPEIQAQQVAPALPTLLVYSNSGPNLDLSWETLPIYPYQLQSRTNLDAGSWLNVPLGESVSGYIHKVAVPRVKETDFFRIKRQ